MNDIEDLNVLTKDDEFELDVTAQIKYPNSPSSDTIKSNGEDMELSSENSPYTLSLRRGEFIDEKDLNRFVKSVEKVVRGCPEYREWTGYIKDTLGHYSCSLTGEVSAQCDVDIHHHPVTLFSTTKAVIMQYLQSSKEFCTFDIAQDVINLHFENKLGYVVMVRTLHQKFHNGFLNLPMDIVHGNWQHIVYEYEHDDDDAEIIQSRLAITRENCGWGDKYKWSKDTYKEE